MNLVQKDKAVATAMQKITEYIERYGSLHTDKSIKWMRKQHGWNAVRLLGWMASKGWVK